MMGILLKLAASKFAPWILLGIVAALGFSHVIVYGNGKTNGVNQERVAQADAVAQAVEQARVEHEGDLKERGWQDATEAQAARDARTELQERLAKLAMLPPKTLIKTVRVPNEQGCNCDVPTLGESFWLHYRAAGRERSEADPPAADAVRTRL